MVMQKTGNLRNIFLLVANYAGRSLFLSVTVAITNGKVLRWNLSFVIGAVNWGRLLARHTSLPIINWPSMPDGTKKKPVKLKVKKIMSKQNGESKVAAPKGNKFWKVRAKHGRKKLFSSPDVLWDSCVQYFEWVDANPLKEEKVFHTDGRITRADISKMRAMTISGLCIFLDIDQTTWGDYRKNKDFSLVTTRAEEIIRTQKFTGAAADMLNANIIARDLGLSDKREHTGDPDNPISMNINVNLVKSNKD